MTNATVTQPSVLSYRNGVLLVLVAGVLWSTVGLGIRSIENAEVWQILLYRSCSLSPFLFIILWLRSGGRPFERIRQSGVPGVIAGLSLVAAYAGGIIALQATSVANAMLLFASAPFFTALLGWLVLREPVRRATFVAIGVAIAGIAIMVSDDESDGAMAGNLAALGSAFGFAVFTVALRWGKTSDMMPSVFLSGLFAIVITGTVCLLKGLPLVLSVNDGSIALVMGVFQVGAGLVLYTLGSKAVPAAELALLSMAEVLLGPIWVWLFIGETAGVYTLIGGAVLLAAIVGNALSGLRRRPPAITSP
ncbi:MAG: EamA family transporter [Alphaproteobacteria bacterium]|nr:EamA family transporter [Alphaproteobacteria bacterium]